MTVPTSVLIRARPASTLLEQANSGRPSRRLGDRCADTERSVRQPALRSRSQQGEHSLDPAVRFVRGLQPKLAEDHGGGSLNSPLTDSEHFGDPRIRAAFGHQGENFPFARRQFAQWRGWTPALHQSGNDRRIEDAFALAYAMHGVDQDGDVRDSLFEQVPDVARLICKQSLRVPRFEILAENHNGRLRPPFTDSLRRSQPFVGVAWRHANVDHCHVGTLQSDESQQCLCIANLPDHFDASVDEQPSQSGPDQHDVVGNYDAHGITASIEIDPFAGGSTATLPPTAPIRSATSTRASGDSSRTASRRART